VVTPIIAEREWLETLGGVPSWNPPHKRTLIIAPHPDDETLGAGGLIAEQCRRGLHVSVIAVTDGEAAYRNSTGLAAIRKREQEQALEKLGVRRRDIVRLRLPDSQVSVHELKLAAMLTPLIPAGTLVLAPWSHDWHPDHEACGRAAERVARNAGAQLIFYLFWIWHQGIPETLSKQNLGNFNLDPQLQAWKRSALDCHASQLACETGPPILPAELREPASRPFETFIVNE
jgi:LmbE family N-acetylglucosaminyl deacetylase